MSSHVNSEEWNRSEVCKLQTMGQIQPATYFCMVPECHSSKLTGPSFSCAPSAFFPGSCIPSLPDVKEATICTLGTLLTGHNPEPQSESLSEGEVSCTAKLPKLRDPVSLGGEGGQAARICDHWGRNTLAPSLTPPPAHQFLSLT